MVNLVPGGVSYSQLGVAVDAAGNVFIADRFGNAITKWTATNGDQTTLISTGLNGPYGVAVDRRGNVYVADTGDNAVKEWTPVSSNLVTLVSGLNGPQGVAVDVAGNVYIADTGNGALREWVSSNGNIITLMSGLSDPPCVAVDGSGNVYTSSSFASLEQMTLLAEWTAAASNVTTFVTFPSSLSYAAGVTLNGMGDLFVSDPNVGQLDEVPNAFVDPTPKVESAAGGMDVLPAVIPSTESLVAPFAPTSDQSWLTITGVTNDVVSFAIAANPGPPRVANITLL